MKSLIFIAALATGCMATSQVGPYVKQVYRQGDFLIMQKCMIQLEGEELHEINCTAEQLPLRNFQQMPPPAPPR